MRQSKYRFAIARGQTTRDNQAQFLGKCRRQRLVKKCREHAVAQVRIHAINGQKPLVTREKRKVVGFPGLFDVDLLAELSEEDQFLGPMRTAIINRDVQSLTEDGSSQQLRHNR